MATIVTYNRGAESNLNAVAARQADPTLGAGFFTDFVALDGITEADCALSGAVPHSLLMDDDATASTFSSGGAVIDATGMDGGEYSCVFRMKVSSARANNDIIAFGFATDITASANLNTGANNLSMKLTQNTAASGDAILCSFDDGTNEEETSVTVSSVDGLSDYDSQDWHYYAMTAQPTSDEGVKVKFFVDGTLIHEKKFDSRGAGGTMECGAHTAASKGGYLFDSFSLLVPTAG